MTIRAGVLSTWAIRPSPVNKDDLQTPESALPRELAYGVLRVSDAPRVPHQRAVARLFLALNQHATDEAIGEVWLSR